MTDTPAPAPAPLLGDTDMAMIPDLLSRVANTIVAASSFAKDVDRMRAELTALSADLKTERDQAVTLRETISAISAERDRLNSALYTAERAAADVTVSMNKVEAEREQAQRDGDEARATLAETRKERDEAQFINLELTDKVAALETKLAKFRSIFEEDQPRPLPVSTPQQTPSTGTSPVQDVSPSSENVPSPSPEPTRHYRNDGESRYWQLDHLTREWDDDRVDYYRVA